MNSKKQDAFHESGHCVAALHLGQRHRELRRWSACIYLEESRSGQLGWSGSQRFYFGPKMPTYFQFAVTAWAGRIADYLYSKPAYKWPVLSSAECEAKLRREFEDHIEVVRRCRVFREEMRKKGDPRWRELSIPFSGGDFESIAMAVRKWQAFKVAWKIIANNRDQVAEIAAELIRNGSVSDKYFKDARQRVHPPERQSYAHRRVAALAAGAHEG
jgi:hypothetical protein